jgi:valyl-tRNA synthetase
LPPAPNCLLCLVGASDATKARLASQSGVLERVGRFESITLADAAPDGSIQQVVGEATLCLAVGDVIDLQAERARLAKEIERLDDEIARIDKKLGNEKFTARAPEEVVQGEREKRAGYEAEKVKVAEALERLG